MRSEKIIIKKKANLQKTLMKNKIKIRHMWNESERKSVDMISRTNT